MINWCVGGKTYKCARYITSLFYPEHFNDFGGNFNEWCKLVEKSQVKAVISPLHHGDTENAKEHYHIMFYCNGTRLPDFWQSLLDSLGCVGGEVVVNVSSMVLYFLHRTDDAADKEQFNDSDLVCLNGSYADVIDWINSSTSDEEVESIIFNKILAWKSKDVKGFIATLSTHEKHIFIHNYMLYRLIKDDD